MSYSHTTLERLVAKTTPLPWTGCEIFTGSLDTSGYGLIGVGGRGNIRKAHRVSYELRVGPIPAGLQVLHRCDVRCCVNPDHLFLGTLQDNMIDRDAKGRQVSLRGSKHSASKLHEWDVLMMREMRAAGVRVTEIADAFQISKSATSSILLGKGWKHVQGNQNVI